MNKWLWQCKFHWVPLFHMNLTQNFSLISWFTLLGFSEPPLASASGVFYLIEMLLWQAHETVFSAAEVLKVGGCLCSCSWVPVGCWLLKKSAGRGSGQPPIGLGCWGHFFTSLQYWCNKLMRHSFRLLKFNVSSFFIVKKMIGGRWYSSRALISFV